MVTARSLLLPLLAAIAAQAAQLSLNAPRVTVTSSAGTQSFNEQISIKKPLAEAVELGPTDTMKLTFQVVEAGSENAVQPHQTFLRFYDESTGEEGIQPIRVGSNGKAKFELNMARPPNSLPPSGDAPLKVSLILGSFVHSPNKFDLFDLIVPASQSVAPHPEAALFRPRPEIHHTFRPEPKVPPTFISTVFAGLVLAPWIVLLGIWGIIQPAAPRLFSPRIFPFTLSLAAMEAIIFWYWYDLRLGQVLLYGVGMAVPLFFSGKRALESISARRTGRL